MNSNVSVGAFDVSDTTILVNDAPALGTLLDGIDQTSSARLLAKSGIKIAEYSLKESFGTQVSVFNQLEVKRQIRQDKLA